MSGIVESEHSCDQSPNSSTHCITSPTLADPPWGRAVCGAWDRPTEGGAAQACKRGRPNGLDEGRGRPPPPSVPPPPPPLRGWVSDSLPSLLAYTPGVAVRSARDGENPHRPRRRQPHRRHTRAALSTPKPLRRSFVRFGQVGEFFQKKCLRNDLISFSGLNLKKRCRCVGQL